MAQVKTAREWAEYFQTKEDPDEPLLLDIWGMEDFRTQASQCYEAQNQTAELTDAELEAAMYAVAHDHDAGRGITWDFVETAVNDILGEKSSC